MKIKKTKAKTILCIVAHPDDEALGVGGTLIKHSRHCENVFLVILSLGEESKIKKSDKNSERLNNAREWSKLAGVSLYKVYNYPDQRLDSIPQLNIVKKLEKIIEGLKPDIVYIHHPNDINKDHQVAAQTTLVALRPITYHKVNPEIRCFETPSSTDQAPYEFPYFFKPNFFVNVQDVWKEKLVALKSYEKELKEFPHPRSLKAIEALATKRGAEAGLKKAEAFYILRKVW